MITRQAWGIGAAVLFGLIIGCLIGQPSLAQKKEPAQRSAPADKDADDEPPTGRFSTERITDSRILLLETTTGHCWSRLVGGRTWDDWGSPVDNRQASPKGKKAAPKGEQQP